MRRCCISLASTKSRAELACPVTLERCIAQHNATVNAPFCAPHVYTWLELFASQAQGPSSTNPLSCSDAPSSRFTILPMSTLTYISQRWQADARAFRVLRIIEMAQLASAEPTSSADASSDTTARSSPESIGTELHQARHLVTLASHEMLIVLWSVHVALALLLQHPRHRTSTGNAGFTNLSESDTLAVLSEWAASHFVPLLNFFMIGEHSCSAAANGGLSPSSCRRAMHAALAVVSDQLLMKVGESSVHSSNSPHATRDNFTRASRLFTEGITGGLENAADARFHRELHTRIAKNTGFSVERDVPHSNDAKPHVATPFEVCLSDFTTHTYRGATRKKSCTVLLNSSPTAPARRDGISLSRPFPSPEGEKELSDEALDRVNAQLTAVALAGSGRS